MRHAPGWLVPSPATASSQIPPRAPRSCQHNIMAQPQLQPPPLYRLPSELLLQISDHLRAETASDLVCKIASLHAFFFASQIVIPLCITWDWDYSTALQSIIWKPLISPRFTSVIYVWYPRSFYPLPESNFTQTRNYRPLADATLPSMLQSSFCAPCLNIHRSHNT